MITVNRAPDAGGITGRFTDKTSIHLVGIIIQFEPEFIMCRQFFGGLLTCLCLGGTLTANAQQLDSAHMQEARAQHDTVGKPYINWDKNISRNSFPYKKMILPASLVVYGVVSLHMEELKSINNKVKEEVYTERQPRHIGVDDYLRYAPAAAVYVLNAAGVHGENNFRDRTMIYGISTLIMGSTVLSVKSIAGEMRPDGSNTLSFPSGHTATAFAAAEFMRQEYKNVSPWYGIAGYAAAAATGYLRISNNKHWCSDVMAGAGIGIISTKLAYWMYPAIKRALFKDRDMNTVIMPSYQNGALGLGMVHHF